MLKWLLIGLVLLLVFGAGRIADLGKGLGDGIRNFKKGVQGDDDDAEGDKKSSKSKGGKVKD